MNVIRLVFVDPIILLLRFRFSEFHAVTGNYGVSLILMSLTVTLLTSPLYYLAERWRRIEMGVQLEKLSAWREGDLYILHYKRGRRGSSELDQGMSYPR